MAGNKAKAVFFDRDGTINEDIGYVSKPENFRMMSGVRPAIMLLKDLDFKVFIVSNQSGVGRGIFSKDALDGVNEKMKEDFKEDGITLDGIKYCLHRPDEQCQCRKPSPKLVKDLATKCHIDLTTSYFVGDKISDVLTGKNAGCRTVLLLSEEESIHLDEEDDEWPFPNFMADDISDAIGWILKDSGVVDGIKASAGLGKKATAKKSKAGS